MDPERAFDVVATACARMHGTLDEHRTIQEALQVLRAAVAVPAPDGTDPAEAQVSR